MKELNIFLDFFNSSSDVMVCNKSDPSLIQRLHSEKNCEIIGFERPDFYINFDDKVVLFEHFSFDSAKQVKKAGSLLKIEEYQKQKEIKASIDKQFDEGKMQAEHNTTYTTEISFEYYEANLVNGLISHSNVSSYIENFRSATKIEKKIEFAICIENTSILPDYVVKGLDRFQILPLNSKLFLETLKSYDAINHVFILHRGLRDKVVYYFQNNSLQVDALLEGVLIDDTFKFVKWVPHSVSISCIIPKE